MFCPKCGGLMVPKKKDGEEVLVCMSCGYEQPIGEAGKIKEKVKGKSAPETIKEKPDLLPKVKIKCPKCGNTEAYTWEIQTRASDEPPTRFYKCTKCGYTWREYE